jgi:hypothetical protein
MTSHNIPKAFVLILSAATIASACGGGSDGAASSADSSYCKTVREWTAHDLTPYDESDPAQLKKYIGEYVAFNTDATKRAPGEIAADWKATSAGFESTVVPVLEKYGYSVERIMTEGTPEEQAVEQPPPDLAAAQDRIHAYEARTCLTGQPSPADVTFAGPADADYCDAAHTLDAAADLSSSAWSPDSVKALVTSPDYAAMQQAGVTAAPPEIHDDVAALATFSTDKVVPVLERYGYDMRRLLVEGSAPDLAIIQSWDPAIVDQYQRVTAYEQQLCGE